ncbi:MAG: prolyl oligopeptidase family serine peptidase [Acidobacteriia bacterium]|nr:prolyl oligopeptidase family serine peptidase [Terriglobia bacterium]
MLRWLLVLLAVPAFAESPLPETVHFPSADGNTRLVGYLFRPQGHKPAPMPAIVMLHGRAGPYSSLAKGHYNAATLSKRHKAWGEHWASRGYIALLVDSFGPRGYAKGFPKGSYEDRPAEVSEQTVRPLDAYGALRYLRGRKDVQPDRIGVQGWSNGGMTVLVTISRRAPGIKEPSRDTGFRAALAEYPGCGMDAVKGNYRNYAPLLLMVASADEEVSPRLCEELAEKARKSGADLELVVYDGAEHNFDDPGKTKQSKRANHKATEDALRRATRFFDNQLRR